MQLTTTALAGVMVVKFPRLSDARGSFGRLFCAQALSQPLAGRQIVQINGSHTVSRGMVRGLHYQRTPYAEMKLVRCLRGRVWDVAVDLRRGSPTFLQWHAEELSAENGRLLVIPEGCAHGFQALEDHSELLYLHTAAYQPAAECGVAVDDARLGLSWPLPIRELSGRDRAHPPLTEDFEGLDP
jgi:dTDP-4-dehydrorhamnose 3,5-epimerase